MREFTFSSYFDEHAEEAEEAIKTERGEHYIPSEDDIFFKVEEMYIDYHTGLADRERDKRDDPC